MKRTVLFLIDSLGVGGAERSVLQIAQRLPTWEPVVCHVHAEDTLLRDGPPPSIPVVTLGVADRRPGPRTFLEFLSLVRRLSPAVIVVTGTASAFLGAAAGRLTRRPVVHTFTNEAFTPAHYASVPSRSRWKLSILRRLYRWSLGRRTRVIAVSQGVRDTNCRTLGFPPSRVTVIHRGREPDVFRRLDGEERATARNRLGLPTTAPVVLHVARLLRRKGHVDLLHAMRRVLDELPEAILLLAGEGHDRRDLEEIGRSLGLSDRVRFLGTRNDVPILLGQADVFAFPSHFEGHPGALVEAMLSSLPIVASDIPVHRETIRHGETGILVPPHDPEALAREIRNLLVNPSRGRDLGTRARDEALRRFDLGEIARLHEEVFERVAESSPRKREDPEP